MVEVEEIWKSPARKQLVDYYEISNLGRLRRIRNNKGEVLLEPTIVKTSLDKKGTLCCSLFPDGAHIKLYIATQVIRTFIGITPYGLKHLDGDKTNCSLSNIQYCVRESRIREDERQVRGGRGKAVPDDPKATPIKYKKRSCLECTRLQCNVREKGFKTDFAKAGCLDYKNT